MLKRTHDVTEKIYLEHADLRYCHKRKKIWQNLTDRNFHEAICFHFYTRDRLHVVWVEVVNKRECFVFFYLFYFSDLASNNDIHQICDDRESLKGESSVLTTRQIFAVYLILDMPLGEIIKMNKWQLCTELVCVRTTYFTTLESNLGPYERESSVVTTISHLLLKWTRNHQIFLQTCGKMIVRKTA